MSDTKPFEYRPAFASHVVGVISPRVWDAEEQTFEEQTIKMTCEKCSQTMKRVCTSGRALEHVARFALGHMHRDVLARNPGSGA